MIQFYHVYWGYRDNKFGRITIASELHANEDNKLLDIEFAISICPPRNTFIKKIGRDTASSRLQNKDPKFYRKITVNYPEDIKMCTIHDKIIDEIHASMNVPKFGVVPENLVEYQNEFPVVS